jgi:hypothetical protein
MQLLILILRSRFLAIVLSLAAVVVFVAGYYHFYLKPSIEQEQLEEIIIENQEDYIETRKKIDEAISKLSPDAESARQRLLERQAKRLSQP